MTTITLNKKTLIQLSIKNSFYSSLGSIATLAVSIFVAGYSIRILGESLAGFLMLMQTIVGVSTSLTDFGFGTSVIKAISEAYANDDTKRIKDLIKATSFFNIVMAALLGAIIILASTSIIVWAKIDSGYVDDVRLSINYFVLSFILSTALSSYKALPSAIQKYDYVSLIAILQAATSGLIQVYVLIVCPSIVNLSIGYMIGSVIQLFGILFISYRLLGTIVMPMGNWSVIKSLFGYSTIVFINSLVYQARNYSDRWILTSLTGAVSLPGYVIGQTLMQKVLSLVTSPFYFIFPMLSSSSVQLDKKNVFKIYSNFHWFVSVMGVCIFAFIALDSFWLLGLWIRKDFALKYNYLFQLACLQGALASFSVVPHLSSYGLGKPSNNLWEASITASIVFILSLIMIPAIGVIGAALAQLIAYVVTVIFIQFQIQKTIFTEFTIGDMFQPILPPIVLGALLFSMIFALNGTEYYANISIIHILSSNAILGVMVLAVVVYEKYVNNESGRYLILVETVGMLRNKIAGRLEQV